MSTTDTDGKPGLRFETAASVVLRDMIAQHLAAFQLAIRTDRLTARNTVAAYVDGLAGAMAFAIQGGHASHDDILTATFQQLRDALNRDLTHLRQTK